MVSPILVPLALAVTSGDLPQATKKMEAKKANTISVIFLDIRFLLNIFLKKSTL